MRNIYVLTSHCDKGWMSAEMDSGLYSVLSPNWFKRTSFWLPFFWRTVDIKAIHFIIVLMLMPDSLSFGNAYIYWANIHLPERCHEYLWLRPNENKLREFKFYGSLFNARHLHLTQIANDDYNHCTIISNSEFGTACTIIWKRGKDILKNIICWSLRWLVECILSSIPNKQHHKEVSNPLTLICLSVFCVYNKWDRIKSSRISIMSSVIIHITGEISVWQWDSYRVTCK